MPVIQWNYKEWVSSNIHLGPSGKLHVKPAFFTEMNPDLKFNANDRTWTIGLPCVIAIDTRNGWKIFSVAWNELTPLANDWWQIPNCHPMASVDEYAKQCMTYWKPSYWKNMDNFLDVLGDIPLVVPVVRGMILDTEAQCLS